MKPLTVYSEQSLAMEDGRPRQTQTDPDKPRQTQTNPDKPRQSQEDPGRPRQTQTVPGRPRRPWLPREERQCSLGPIETELHLAQSTKYAEIRESSFNTFYSIQIYSVKTIQMRKNGLWEKTRIWQQHLKQLEPLPEGQSVRSSITQHTLHFCLRLLLEMSSFVITCQFCST